MSSLFSPSTHDEHADAATACFLRVAVERGLDRGGGDPGGAKGLTYRSPFPIPVGRRVEVPLGRGDKTAAGIVIQTGGLELADGLSPDRIKPISRDTGAGLPERLVDLARWMATYYVCPLGMVLTTMLPAAVKHRTGLRTRIELSRAEAAPEAEVLGSLKLPAATRKTWESVEALGRGVFPLTPEELASAIGAATVAGISRLVKLGLLLRSEREEVRASGGAPTQLMIEQADPHAPAKAARPELTPDQRSVFTGIGATLDRFGVHLIRGVTGSGKTEVYLQLIEQVLGAGKTALVLVPEISLTPQTAGRFNERFGRAGVAVLHSGLSASQRHREWSRAAGGGGRGAAGSARVVVGARSAVFAPLPNLGLIVVDEEHAGDYKQDSLPRYHGRDVAIKRAHMEGCPCVLGTATPSLESWANATGANPKYALWELNSRVGGGRLPPVEIVDLRDEYRQLARSRGRPVDPGVIGPTLEAALRATLAEGGQAILLLNRRGYSGYIACTKPQCGHVLRCDHCDANMVHHKWIATGERGRGGPGGQHAPRRALVRCHHCLAQTLLPDRCPVCESPMTILLPGTQRVEEELLTKLADTEAARSPLPWLARVDGDTMGSARDYFDLLGKFAAGEIRVLLGTQMIAKGLDFPNVRLVGVLNADTALTLPDFRAAERTFQLISQVAGRAGRGTLPGRVIVQTYEPHAPAVRLAAAHDYVTFAAEELACRADSHLPPITRMARLVVRDEDLAKAEAQAKQITAALREELGERADQVRIDGPMPCPISRIAGFHRIAIELTASNRTILQEILSAVRARGLVKSDARIAVDIDPIALA